MTTVYFIRHAESDISVRDARMRPLTEKGLADRHLVTAFLRDKRIDAVLSSPYKRAVDTVSCFAKEYGFTIETVEGFTERRRGGDWDTETEFYPLIKRQWADFSYTYSDGERLADVQTRNIAALKDVLIRYAGKNIVIGTHGIALSTIINYYDPSYGFDDFMAMVNLTPWVVRMDFQGTDCAGMVKTDLFQPLKEPDDSLCEVNTADPGTLKAYRFVVVFARYQNQWLYCRAKERGVFETAGGHIERGETPLDAARRELYEETGALRLEMVPVFDYRVRLPSEYSNGQVFYAEVYALGDMPDHEMAEVKPFDAMPDHMRFPKILPALYERMRVWLEARAEPGERAKTAE